MDIVVVVILSIKPVMSRCGFNSFNYPNSIAEILKYYLRKLNMHIIAAIYYYYIFEINQYITTSMTKLSIIELL